MQLSYLNQTRHPTFYPMLPAATAGSTATRPHMINTVFDKTDKGREEIATRATHLAARLRTLLLLVDGRRDTVELMAKVAGLGLDEKALAELLDGGFIRVHENASAVAVNGVAVPDEAIPKARGQADAIAEAAPADSIGPGQPETPLSTRPVLAADPTTLRSAAAKGILRDGETQYQALYNFFNETIRSAIGLRGYALQLKVERATSIADFHALRQTYLDGVLKAKGPELEHSLRNRLDQLLSLGD